MKIGINALHLLPNVSTVSDTYITSLVHHLLEANQNNTYCIFINEESKGIFPESDPRVEVILCPVKAPNRLKRFCWEQFILPFHIRSHKIDVLLSAGMTAPFICQAPSVLIIYDLQHINQPQNFPPFYLFLLKTVIYLSAKTAERIITISEHVKLDIIRHYRIRRHRIMVGYVAVNQDRFFPIGSEDTEEIRTKYELPEHYILYTASLLPHKNHELLLQAFREVHESFPGTTLVLTGAWESGYDKTMRMIKEFGLQNSVIIIGWLPLADIPAVFRGAELFVYPTLHEEFGLPVLEAMASGVPVVCSGIEPLLEVAGDAALFVDPYDHKDIARGMLRALREREERSKLIKKGLHRVRNFTWEKTARDTLEFLKGLVGTQPSLKS